jgi:hypothetical protein
MLPLSAGHAHADATAHNRIAIACNGAPQDKCEMVRKQRNGTTKEHQR